MWGTWCVLWSPSESARTVESETRPDERVSNAKTIRPIFFRKQNLKNYPKTPLGCTFALFFRTIVNRRFVRDACSARKARILFGSRPVKRKHPQNRPHSTMSSRKRNDCVRRISREINSLRAHYTQSELLVTRGITSFRNSFDVRVGGCGSSRSRFRCIPKITRRKTTLRGRNLCTRTVSEVSFPLVIYSPILYSKRFCGSCDRPTRPRSRTIYALCFSKSYKFFVAPPSPSTTNRPATTFRRCFSP